METFPDRLRTREERRAVRRRRREVSSSLSSDFSLAPMLTQFGIDLPDEIPSSSPVKSNIIRRGGGPLPQLEGDVVDALASSSASDAETVSGDSAQSGDGELGLAQIEPNCFKIW